MTRLILTRPRDQAQDWLEQFASRGIDAANLPLLDVGPAPDASAVRVAWHAIGQGEIHAVMFVSPSAVERFFALRGEVPWPQGTLALAPGPGTLRLAERLGVPRDQCLGPDEQAEQFDSEALWQVLQARQWRGKRVLVARGEGGRDWLIEQWQAAGAQVEVVQAYQRGPAVWTDYEQHLAQAALADPRQHLWLFSSSEGLRHLPALIAPWASWETVRATLRSVTTHPRIAEQARELGLVDVRTARPDIDSVMRCIQ